MDGGKLQHAVILLDGLRQKTPVALQLTGGELDRAPGLLDGLRDHLIILLIVTKNNTSK